VKRLLLIAVGLVALAGCSVPITGAANPAPDVSVMRQAGPIAPAAISKPVKVDIPALNISDDIVPVGLAPDRTMEIPPVEHVGFYELGVHPGAQGPAVLAGHVNYKGVAGSFARLGELKAGDRVTVTGDDGNALTFEVYEVRQFPKASFDYQFVFGNRNSADIVLVTCSGTVEDHNYSDNTAVAARLVQP
jgi:LPXTG-site transpeptidase (sortase) family protein